MFSPPQEKGREYLDTPGQDPGELSGLLHDVRRTNRWYGGYRLIRRYLGQFIPLIPARPLTLLDVATASADVPRAIVGWARARGVAIRLTAVDLSEDILAVARREVAGYPEIRLARADALRLPFPDRAVDVVICGLALHHFTLEESAQVLREIDRVARAGFVVNDVVRSWGAYVGAWLDTRLLSRNRLARHDGPLSVLRSYTVPEFRRVLQLAGCHRAEIHAHPLFRVAIVRRPDAGGMT